MDAFGPEEAQATAEALHTCGMLSLPYPLQTVKYSGDAYCRSPSWDSWRPSDEELMSGPEMFSTFAVGDVTFNPADNKIGVTISGKVLVETADGNWFECDLRTGLCRPGPHTRMSFTHMPAVWLECAKDMATDMTLLLVTALNTKNVVKHTGLNKRASRGIGKGKYRTGGIIHLSCTTFSLPPTPSCPSGRTMPLHLRRGHVHRWRKGDGTFAVKFLPAMLVNKDKVTGTVKMPEYEVNA